MFIGKVVRIEIIAMITAAACAKKARDLTDAHMAKLDASTDLKCPRCTDGKMKMTISSFGSGNTSEVFVSACFNCHGAGTITEKTYRTQYMQKCVWCKCDEDNERDFVRARDGRKVFGKDTYLCADCGMVVQFG